MTLTHVLWNHKSNFILPKNRQDFGPKAPKTLEFNCTDRNSIKTWTKMAKISHKILRDVLPNKIYLMYLGKSDLQKKNYYTLNYNCTKIVTNC